MATFCTQMAKVGNLPRWILHTWKCVDIIEMSVAHTHIHIPWLWRIHTIMPFHCIRSQFFFHLLQFRIMNCVLQNLINKKQNENRKPKTKKKNKKWDHKARSRSYNFICTQTRLYFLLTAGIERDCKNCQRPRSK